ncbi:MAG: nitrilase-related carbon-nitrogen hydrolase [Pirellulales bacterium]|nr:nitrilase-related carbon-nitrogen hydrolase [Pirellulales bacterium]
MSQFVTAGLIQATLSHPATAPLAQIKQGMIDKHVALVEQIAAQGAQIACLQELFYGPYFPAEQNARWFELAERVPDGPTTRLFSDLARRLKIVLILPVMEEDLTGLYYNTAAVIDATGEYLGKFRKLHLPHCEPGFWEKFYFRPGNLGLPVFSTRAGRIGVYLCYDRHFPEGWRALGLGGAEIVFNPSATVAGLSEYLWKLEQPAAAANNLYYVGAINRPGWEEPWRIGEFYGSSYFADPRGQILVTGARDADALITAELNMDAIREARQTWQFYRDRRPECYTGLTLS